MKPVIGRTIQPFDIGWDGQAAPVVVLSYKLWQRLFDGRESALGEKLVLSDVPYTVIGVMPDRFGWFTGDGFWLPMPMDLKDENGVNAIMRLAPGVTKEVAEQQLHALNQQLARATPQNFPKGDFRTVFMNYMDITVASGEMSSSLRLLLAAVGFLLLIACVNVANLQLARTTTRAREIALRLSVGANRGRLVRQLLTESVLLSLLGGIVGVLLAIGITQAIAALIPDFYKPNEARITINGWVLLFSFVVSVLDRHTFRTRSRARSLATESCRFAQRRRPRRERQRSWTEDAPHAGGGRSRAGGNPAGGFERHGSQLRAASQHRSGLPSGADSDGQCATFS